MRKSYLWITAIIGMATLLSACSKDNNGIDDPKAEDNVEILAKSKALSLNVTTKTPFEGDISGTNTLPARVLVSTVSGNYTSTHADGTMTFNNDNTTAVGYDGTPSGSKFYPGNTRIYMVGLYPAATWSVAGTTATYTINGKSDIMTAQETYTDKTGGAKTLTFEHKLTKLDILAVAADEATSTAWGKITDLSLTDAKGGAVNSVATVTLADGTTAFGTSVASIPFYTTADVAITGLTTTAIAIPEATAAKVAYSMVAPITLDGSTATQTEVYTLSIKTTTSGSTALEVPISVTPNPVTITSTAGYAFTITLTFSGTQITAKATVTEWIDGGTGSGTIS